MNLTVLHQTISESLDRIRPAIDHVFTQTIAKVEKTGRAVNVNSFTARMNKALLGTGVRVTVERDVNFGKPEDATGLFYPATGGYCYDPCSEDRTARIQLVLSLHPKSNRLPMSLKGWEYFRFRLLKTALHELVHRAQYARGRLDATSLVFRPHVSASVDPKVFDKQAYLGDIDEVEAFARDCVEEWYYVNPLSSLTLAGIKRDFRDTRHLPAVQYYYETFGGDETHLSVQRFFRKVKAWNELITPIAGSLPPVSPTVRRERNKHPVQVG